MLCLRRYSLLFLSFLVDPVETAFPFSKGGNRWTQRGKTKMLADLTGACFCLYDSEVGCERIRLRVNLGSNMLREKIKSCLFAVCHLNKKGHFLVITFPQCLVKGKRNGDEVKIPLCSVRRQCL